MNRRTRKNPLLSWVMSGWLIPLLLGCSGLTGSLGNNSIGPQENPINQINQAKPNDTGGSDDTGAVAPEGSGPTTQTGYDGIPRRPGGGGPTADIPDTSTVSTLPGQSGVPKTGDDSCTSQIHIKIVATGGVAGNACQQFVETEVLDTAENFIDDGFGTNHGSGTKPRIITSHLRPTVEVQMISESTSIDGVPVVNGKSSVSSTCQSDGTWSTTLNVSGKGAKGSCNIDLQIRALATWNEQDFTSDSSEFRDAVGDGGAHDVTLTLPFH